MKEARCQNIANGVWPCVRSSIRIC